MLRKINLKDNTINELIKDGYLKLNQDKYSNLQLLNYTDKAQFDKVWNDYTLECRGLIFDDSGTIIARPLCKFFNYEEVDNIPNCDFQVYEKLDGSLGIVYYYNDKWNIATRGSFNSDQAVFARENLMISNKQYIDLLDKSNTYLFEIIYSDNRIVVDYENDERLVLLACINTNSGQELDIENIDYPDKAKIFEFKDFKSITDTQLKEDIGQEEGYVIKFKDGTRLKMKYEKYKSLHKLMMNFTPKVVWESLKNNTPIDLSTVPDEFYNQVKDIQLKYQNEFERKYNELLSIYKSIPVELKEDKKLFAQFVMQNHKLQQKYLFSFFSQKESNIAEGIWQEIKDIC
jgi:RNA ligase